MPSRKMSLREQREARRRIRELETHLDQVHRPVTGTTVQSGQFSDTWYVALTTAQKLGHTVVLQPEYDGKQGVRMVAVPRPKGV